jgi:hypothetical protein
MKQKCKHLLAVVLLSHLALMAPAQLTDAEAIERARPIVAALAPEYADFQGSVWRDSLSVRGRVQSYMQVLFGEVRVTLADDGTFGAFSNLAPEALRPRRDAPDKYSDDDQAWRALEELLDGLDLALPANLERAELKRYDTDTYDYVYSFYLRPAPYGYANSAGNYVAAELHRVTGRVLHLSIARGWQYELPNVRVSEQEAVQIAIALRGGVEADWIGRQLQYMSMAHERAPAYLKTMMEEQKMRLMYIISSRDGKAVMIDSVTGTVVDSWQADSSAHSGREVVGGTDSASKSPDSGRGSNQVRARRSTTTGLTIGAVAGVIALVVAVYIRRRARFIA